MDSLRVAAASHPKRVAGALVQALRTDSVAEIHAISAGAVKAIAIARGYVTSEGHDLVCLPSFDQVEVGGEMRTALRLVVVAQATPIPQVRLMSANHETRPRGPSGDGNGRSRATRVAAQAPAGQPV